MTHILFVDDDPAILRSLQNLLRKDRGRWDMHFALGAEAALQLLETESVDIIVSDMRMPGMDGAELLKRVKASHPRIARLVLSGHAEREAVFRSVPVSHQFFSKPCDAETLRTALERTSELQRLVENETITSAVGQMDKLPSVPPIYAAVVEAARRPQTTIADFGAIVRRDPAMTVKVLQLVNSAYFGSSRRIVSIEQAIAYLGIELLKALTLTAHVFSTLDAHPIPGFSVSRFQFEAVSGAALAKRLVSDAARAEEAFTAALVRDIGIVVLGCGLPERYAEVSRLMAERKRTLFDCEREVFGVSHAEVGAYLIGLWGLPFSIVEAVGYHHRPSSVQLGDRTMLAAVHAADAFITAASDGEDPATLLDPELVNQMGLAGELERWQTIANEVVATGKTAA